MAFELRIWTAGVVLAWPLLLTGCELVSYLLTGPPPAPPITIANNRIEQFLYREPGYKNIQAFVERELGTHFSEEDFVRYMEANEAECERDPIDTLMYCRYVSFKFGRSPWDIYKTFNAVSVYCFWARPAAGRPDLDVYQPGADRVDEFPTDRREYARSVKLADCWTLLNRWRFPKEEGTDR